MTEQSAWSFTDDRGRPATADRRPARVLAYVQAGATLWDHGIRPEGIFGSGHDGSEPDRAKTGTLPLDAVNYRGAGDDLDVDTLLRGKPDLVVAVSYGHGRLYGLDPDTAKHLEERVPVVVIDVGQARTLARVTGRFAELAVSLGGAPDPGAAGDLHAARERLRAAARATPGAPAVAALSPASQEQAYAARPRMWPELRVLAELGVSVVSPPEGPGVNWATVGWAEAAAMEPRIVLTDVRANALPLDEIAAPAWEAVRQRTRTVPWNPEPLCSPQAHARFLGLVAEALEATASG
ncbi:ABC transporter substrate-binding protein [Streptomyces sp. NRRL S-4]|uniref:ABC transporter substrate-binding protein n=1 Tax=Streptomyces sp. NRRL S-4 TaxID=1519471 RepID=UPI0006B55493|nr:ABC transporter substrate-binding protein [Streptomyces sp. NRRL S-4]KPC80995.1 ABC transporter substrate-binding protein [Streptomyces sp. NRRL S-4]